MRYQYREVFNNLLSRFGYSGKQVAAWADLHESKISRFRTGKLDLETGEFFQMLDRLPKEAQAYFWEQMLGRSLSVNELVRGMDEAQMQDLLNEIADSWREARQRKAELQLSAS